MRHRPLGLPGLEGGRRHRDVRGSRGRKDLNRLNRLNRDYPRALRVNEVLRQVVAEELERLADADERLRLVTVTSVEVSTDLRAATVFLGSLEPDAAAALDERRAQVQRAVGRQVRMKRTPRLSFEADPAVRAGERVEEILRRLDAERHGSSGTGDPGGPGAGPVGE